VILQREVVVIGGGPAGCVTSMLLAHHGHQVLVVSDSRREGGLPVETVVPGATPLFQRLNLLDAIEKPNDFSLRGPQHHGRCWSQPTLEVQSIDERERGWRFLRPAFDLWLRGRAQEAGVEFISAGRAIGSIPSTGQGVITIQGEQGPITVEATRIIAATGRSSCAPLLPVEIEDQLPPMIALSTVIDDLDGEKDTSIIEAVPQGWVWWLPFGDGRCNLALLCDPAQVRQRGAQELWAQAMACTAGPARNSGDASCRGTVATARLNRCTEGLHLVGDAISAIDPLSSQGLEKALVSAEATARATRTVLLGEADAVTMADHRQRWERGLFRLHRQRALTLYRSEQRFSDQPFWQARHAIADQPHRARSLPTGTLTPSPDLQPHPRWVPQSDRLVKRAGFRLASSDEESIDHFGSIPSATMLELVGDQLPMDQMHQRASQMAPLVEQSAATISSILGEMCRLGWLLEE